MPCSPTSDLFAFSKASNAEDGRRFISVTLPNRKVQEGREATYYDFLRGKREDYDRIREAVRAAFRQYAAEQGIEVPEDAEAGPVGVEAV